MIIQSHRGPYRVAFGTPFAGLDAVQPNTAVIVDRRVAELYAKPLATVLATPTTLLIEATEAHKSLERMPEYALHLINSGLKRDWTLVAIGGGIIQDIVCFLAATLLRGLPWRFYPTTLLAQADSCIGSKSSINVGKFKNQLGTFTPPTDIHVSTGVLKTLAEGDVRSGLGEVIKVHVISGWDDVNALSRDYPRLQADPALLEQYVRRSLEIKRLRIEADEFDQGPRLVLNYGHTFGHAIESATAYAVPHGIGVTIGMDFANFVSWKFGLIDRATFDTLHALTFANYGPSGPVVIPEAAFFSALSRDKKNRAGDVALVLLRRPGDVFLDRYPNDERFKDICREFLARVATRAS
ncbi:MAG: 3-dehydroquinate synthase [Acidobacteria bacterium]|nr:MAG: 3-dehydroquinate synthase [Acidobacteriota bacterium]